MGCAARWVVLVGMGRGRRMIEGVGCGSWAWAWVLARSVWVLGAGWRCQTVDIAYLQGLFLAEKQWETIMVPLMVLLNLVACDRLDFSELTDQPYCQ